MSEANIIDTKMHGHDGITAAFLVPGRDATALVETGPRSAVDNVIAGLAELGVDRLDWIVVTHIHLDHAGAAGTLAARFPEATVAVHGVGAPHLIDPSKLWSSAARIYGDEMDALWGGIDPVPRERIRILEDGDRIELGGRTLEAVETPGHARHHHAYADSDTGAVFAGDALGVRLPEAGVIRPTTPPPEFDIEAAVDSIRRIDKLDAPSLWFTHYGPTDKGPSPMGTSEACDRAIEALRRWEEWVLAARRETNDLDEATALVRAEARATFESELDPTTIERLEQTTSYRMNTWGYMRYLDKQTG